MDAKDDACMQIFYVGKKHRISLGEAKLQVYIFKISHDACKKNQPSSIYIQ